MPYMDKLTFPSLDTWWQVGPNGTIAKLIIQKGMDVIIKQYQ
jgi:hypothetical protein